MKALILGGGISGLAAAYFLRQRDPKASITLLEEQARLGGWIETRTVSDFTFEMGPRTFHMARSQELLDLIRDLGLTHDLLFSDPVARKRFLLHRGKLRSIQSLWSLWPYLLSACVRDLFAPKGDGLEESICAFACRRFGKTAAERFFDPLAKGIFAGDIQTLSLDACFPQLRQWEMTHRSILKAAFGQPKQPEGLFTLRGGMGRLIDALGHLPIDIHTQCKVESIRHEGVFAGGKLWDADIIISALPGSEIARLCGVHFALRYESLTVVTMGWQGAILPKKGYGYLVASIEREPLLGQIWDSLIFPAGTQTKVTSMIRSASPKEAAPDAMDAMRRHLGVSRVPDAMCIKHAVIPQYEIGHAHRISAFTHAVTQRYPKLKLIGNYLQGASVRECCYLAKQVIAEIF